MDLEGLLSQMTEARSPGGGGAAMAGTSPAPGAPLPDGAKVRNTFIEFDDEEDPWNLSNGGGPRRQMTDSVLERSKPKGFSLELEQNIIATLQSHLGLGEQSSSSTRPSVLPFGIAPPDPPIGNLRQKHSEAEALLAGLGTLCKSRPGMKGGDLQGKLKQMPKTEEICEEEPEPSPPANDLDTQNAVDTLADEGALAEADDLEEEDPDKDNKKQTVDPALQAMRDTAARGGGLSGCTTIMIRHIPCKYSQRKLMREINSAGFLGRYDFFYLPMDPRSHANRGFAFLNFVSEEVAEEFYRMFHGQRLKHFNSEKVIAVMPADLQGFAQNAAHYTTSRALRRKRTQHSNPLFFRPLPAHLVVDDNIEVHLDQPIYTGPLCDTSSWQMPQQMPAVMDNYVQNLPKRAAQPQPRRAQQSPAFQGGSVQSRGGYARSGNESLNNMPLAARAQGPTQSSRFSEQAQGAGQRKPRFCAFCGHQRTSDHLFCPYCGIEFHEF